MASHNLIEGELSGDKLDIIYCNIKEILGLPSEASVWVYRDDFLPSTSDWLYKPVSLAVKGEDNKEQRYFYGFVSECQYLSVDEHQIKYKIIVKSEIWFGQYNQGCHIFQNISVIDIIRQKIDALGIADYEVSIVENYPSIEYCAQYNESDLSFVTRLLEQYGVYYYLEHDKNSCKMVFIDSNSTHRPLGEFMDFIYLPSNDSVYTPNKNLIREWSAQSHVEPKIFTRRQFDYLKPSSPYEIKNVSTLDFLLPKEVYQYPSLKQSQSDSEPENQVCLQRRSQCQFFIGQTASPHLCCGYRFNLNEHPASSQNSEYLITELNYEIHNGEFRSSEANQSSIQCTFKAVPQEQQFRLNMDTPRPIVAGTDTAIVVGPKGKEIYADEFGRVKVQFHWDRQGKRDENSSCWVRVAQGWSGGGYGYISVPRINEEVIMSYIHGNPDFPIITGRVYNKQMTTPYPLPVDANISGWKTKSTPNGNGYNEFILDDTNGSELVRLKAEKDLVINVLNDRSEKTESNLNEEVGNNKSVLISGNEKNEVQGDYSKDVNGDINIKSMGKITFECNGSKITLGPEGINIEAGAVIKINGVMVKIN